VRTTLTLDDDVAAALRRLQAETGAPWKQVVNDLLRAGLSARDAGRRRPRRIARTRSVRLGQPIIGDVANVHEALSLAEGDARR
jgi:hypothetical protein